MCWCIFELRSNQRPWTQMDAADVEQMRKRDKYSDVAPSFDCRLHDHHSGCFCLIRKKKYQRELLRVTFGF